MRLFPLIDQYFGTLLDMDVSRLKPGVISITETSRRQRCEQSFSFVHALFGIVYLDGSAAISVTPGARLAVLEMMERTSLISHDPFPQEALDRLATCISQARVQAGLPPAKRAYEAQVFACNDTLLRRYQQGDCRQLCDEMIRPAEGLTLPTHCFPDGIVYGIVEDHQVVSVAYAHRSGILEDWVADLGVETAAPYRQRGFAKTVVSSVTAHVMAKGGEGVYTCSVHNQASIATAISVGYAPYGRIFVVSAPPSIA
jgi:hypothetical protein